MLTHTDNIFRLQISMNNSLAMKIFNALNYLSDIPCSFLLSEWSTIKNFLIEIMIAILHNQVNFISADMKSISWKNVGMLTVQMNFHFVDEVLQFDFFLAKGFNGNHHGVDIGNCENDISSLTFAHLANHFQFIFWPFECLHFSHFLQCLVHIIQFNGYRCLFLKKFIIQPTRRVVRLKFFLNFIDVACSISIAVANLFQIS